MPAHACSGPSMPGAPACAPALAHLPAARGLHREVLSVAWHPAVDQGQGVGCGRPPRHTLSLKLGQGGVEDGLWYRLQAWGERKTCLDAAAAGAAVAARPLLWLLLLLCAPRPRGAPPLSSASPMPQRRTRTSSSSAGQTGVPGCPRAPMAAASRMAASSSGMSSVMCWAGG